VVKTGGCLAAADGLLLLLLLYEWYEKGEKGGERESESIWTEGKGGRVLVKTKK
jgi:hypothetical protein